MDGEKKERGWKRGRAPGYQRVAIGTVSHPARDDGAKSSDLRCGPCGWCGFRGGRWGSGSNLPPPVESLRQQAAELPDKRHQTVDHQNGPEVHVRTPSVLISLKLPPPRDWARFGSQVPAPRIHWATGLNVERSSSSVWVWPPPRTSRQQQLANLSNYSSQSTSEVPSRSSLVEMNKNWGDRADKDLFFTILSVKNIGVISGGEWTTIGSHMRQLGYGFTNEGCRCVVASLSCP